MAEKKLGKVKESLASHLGGRPTVMQARKAVGECECGGSLQHAMIAVKKLRMGRVCAACGKIYPRAKATRFGSA